MSHYDTNSLKKVGQQVINELMKNILLVWLTSFSKRLFIAVSANCFDSSNFSSATLRSSSVTWDPEKYNVTLGELVFI